MDTPQPPQVRVDEPTQTNPVESSSETAQSQPAPAQTEGNVATNDVEMGGTLNAAQPEATPSDVQEIVPVPAKKTSNSINFLE